MLLNKIIFDHNVKKIIDVNIGKLKAEFDEFDDDYEDDGFDED